MTVVSMPEAEWQALLKSISLKNPRELARAISYAENEPTVQVPSSASASRVIGITGSPGVGKSTTVNALITSLRSEGKTIVGDRIRLGGHFLDPHVFIRSIATRGHLGGLSATIESIINIVKLAGFDYIFVETVGVGQSEVEVMKFVETVVVVMAPGMGDGIQASKAGILEIGDIFLVNKSDRDGANETAKELESSLHLSAKPLGWIPLVLLGAMEKSVGITELISAIDQHGEKNR